MASNSNHYGDVLTWIEKVINSCTTVKQILAAKKLLILFDEKYAPEYSSPVHIKMRALEHLQNHLWGELMHMELTAESNKLNALIEEGKSKGKKTIRVWIKKSCATCYHVWVSNHDKPCNTCDKEYSNYLTK